MLEVIMGYGKSRHSTKHKVRAKSLKIGMYEDDMARLKRLCKRLDRSGAWVIREALYKMEVVNGLID
jgi:predicted DNA-binding protein